VTRRRHGGRGNIERCLRQVARVPCSAAAGPDGVRRRGMLAHGAALTGRGAALMLAAARRRRRSRRRYRLGSRSGSWSLWSGQQLGSAGLLTQARRGRQLLLEGSGAAGGGIGSKPELEPEPRSAAGADCPVARRAHAAGGSVRTDCPTHIGTAWTPAAVRRRRRCDQTPACVCIHIYCMLEWSGVFKIELFLKVYTSTHKATKLLNLGECVRKIFSFLPRPCKWS
jgi:hypothetical protein